MYYVWVVMDYSCPKGHRNRLDKFYSSFAPISENMFRKRLPRALPCSSCLPDSISLPPSEESARVDVRVIPLDEAQLGELDSNIESFDEP